MLLLAIKKGKGGLYIGDDVVIRIKDIIGDRVSLAIDAPRHIRVLREEILWKGQDEDDKYNR